MSVWSPQYNQQQNPQNQQRRSGYSNAYGGNNQPQTNQQNNQGGMSPSAQTYDRMTSRQSPSGSMMTSANQPSNGGSGFAGYNPNGTSSQGMGYSNTQARSGYGLGGNYNPGLSGNRRRQPIAPSPAVQPQAVPQQTVPQNTVQQPQQPIQASPTQYFPGGAGFDAYGEFADAVGHEGIAKSGMNRDAYRDAWMGSGISTGAEMDNWLAQHGGQRLNDAGVVRTPFGEILDMGIGYKGGRGRPGWTDIGYNG